MRNKGELYGVILMGIQGVLVVALLVAMISTQFSEKMSKASIEEVSGAILASVDTESKMQESTNRMFRKMYGLNAGDYEGVVYYKPATGMAAQELLLVKLKNSSQSEEVTAAIHQRLDSQKSSFEGYGVEQTALLKDAIVDARGNYVFFIVHESAHDADSIFRKSL